MFCFCCQKFTQHLENLARLPAAVIGYNVYAERTLYILLYLDTMSLVRVVPCERSKVKGNTSVQYDGMMAHLAFFLSFGPIPRPNSTAYNSPKGNKGGRRMGKMWRICVMTENRQAAKKSRDWRWFRLESRAHLIERDTTLKSISCQLHSWGNMPWISSRLGSTGVR